MTSKVTDLLKGIDVRRIDRHAGKLGFIQVLALLIHAREELKRQGRDPALASELLDHVDRSLTYDEAKDQLDAQLTGAEACKWVTRE